MFVYRALDSWRVIVRQSRFSPMAHRRGRVIYTDSRRFVLLHVSNDGQEREQGSDD
jgi:hypothetical protein